MPAACPRRTARAIVAIVLATIVVALVVGRVTRPAGAQECDPTVSTCDTTTTAAPDTTTTAAPDTTTTAAPDTTTTDAPTTTTRASDPSPTTTEPHHSATTTTTTTPTRHRRRSDSTTTTTQASSHRTTTTTAQRSAGGGASADAPPAPQPFWVRLPARLHAAIAAATTSTVPGTPTTAGPGALSYAPIPAITTTTKPEDHHALDAALAAHHESGSRTLGISDKVLAVVLGFVALSLLATDRVRRLVDRAGR